MYYLKQKRINSKFTSSQSSRFFGRSGLFVIWLALAAPLARAICQEGCLSHRNTALGNDALISDTTGRLNTATGHRALFSNTTGGLNTASGVNALRSNTTGAANTASGADALESNTTGTNNTAMGVDALVSNTTGSFNTAIGLVALVFNTTGNFNMGSGSNALYENTTGNSNTASGALALFFNTTGNNNVATGFDALPSNTSGSSNTAMGNNALQANTTGDSNIAIGDSAGSLLTTGSNNIDIGNSGVIAEADTIRIGTSGTQTRAFVSGISDVAVTGSTVVVNSDGQLGVLASSARYKENVQPMADSSEAILGLRPVTFRYKKELDAQGIPQFGLVAEEVEKVNPALVIRDDKGKPFTVRYEAVSAMLLNEFLKEHEKVKELEATVAKLKSTVEKVSARMETNQSQLRLVEE